MAKQMTLGVIVGNRGFFPSHLATSGRLEMIAALQAAGIKPIVLTPEETAHGAVESYEDAKKCAALFKKHAGEIDGIIITLPNFGEERGLCSLVSSCSMRCSTSVMMLVTFMFGRERNGLSVTDRRHGRGGDAPSVNERRSAKLSRIAHYRFTP